MYHKNRFCIHGYVSPKVAPYLPVSEDSLLSEHKPTKKRMERNIKWPHAIPVN
jgi:hypothetical protein